MKVETLKLGLVVLNPQFPIFTLGGSLSAPKPLSPPASIAILLRPTFAFSARFECLLKEITLIRWVSSLIREGGMGPMLYNYWKSIVNNFVHCVRLKGQQRL